MPTPNNIERLWQLLRSANRGVTDRPYLHIPLMATGGALLGRYLVPAGARMIGGLLGGRSGLTGSTSGYDTPQLRAMGLILGGLVGTGLAASQHADTGAGGNLTQSLLDGQYWKKNPQRAQAREQRWLQRRNAVRHIPSSTSGGTLPNLLQKNESDLWGNLSEDDGLTIPADRSIALISKDPVLKPPEKAFATRLLQPANAGQGLMSRRDLTLNALKAGRSFIPAYAFGRGVGAVLGLPGELVDRISIRGGLANALYRSGIFYD